MKIVRKDKYSMCEFGELEAGDVFIEVCADGEFIQMKTMLTGDGHSPRNSIALASGEMYYIENTTLVHPVHAELIIENIEEG